MSEKPTPAYHLQKAREREHILHAIVLAQREWRRVIEVVEAAPTAGQAQLAVQEVFSLTPHQAMAVMDMQVRRVAAVERDKITDDLAKVALTSRSSNRTWCLCQLGVSGSAFRLQVLISRVRSAAHGS